MKPRNLAVLTSLPLVLTVLVAAPTQAAVPQCNGLDATIVGTTGADQLTGTEGADVVYLDAGSDTFAGKGGDDVICAGGGADRIDPGAGDDTVLAGGGNDRILGSSGDDTLDGGGNTYDRLSYLDSGATALRLDLRDHTATKGNGTDTVSGFAFYHGTTGADTLIGTTTDDRFYGEGGDDTIYGFGGNDHINVHDGSPTIYGGDGNDGIQSDRLTDSRIALGNGDDNILFRHMGTGNRWTGGAGTDTVAPSSGGLRMEVNLNQGFIRFIGSGVRWNVAGFENAAGSYGADRIVGTASANLLRGNGGADTVIGLAGDDRLIAKVNYYYPTQLVDGGAGTDTCMGWNVVRCEARLW